MDLEPIAVRLGPDGLPVIDGSPRRVGFSLGLLYDGTSGRRWLTVESGDVVVRGVDPSGVPVELRYRATEFRPEAAPGVDEGGVLVCERVG